MADHSKEKESGRRKEQENTYLVTSAFCSPLTSGRQHENNIISAHLIDRLTDSFSEMAFISLADLATDRPNV